MIDKSRKYWYGDSSYDIDEYLKEYTGLPEIDIKPVICRACGSDLLAMRLDANEEAIQVKCPKCGAKKILLDFEEVWEDAKPKLRKCAVCKTGKEHNVKVGFVRRENGSVSLSVFSNNIFSHPFKRIKQRRILQLNSLAALRCLVIEYRDSHTKLN